MADEEIVKVLHEIRDLQKTRVELYKSALSNQQSKCKRMPYAVKSSWRRCYLLLSSSAWPLLSQNQ
jgi:hypothetical protein